MKKRDISYYQGKIQKRIHKGEFSAVCLLNDGRILKIFDNGALAIFKAIGYDIEKNILDSDKYQINPKIKTHSDNYETFYGEI